ncbi:hypothetical protein QJS10_CPA10g00091 [Acorus calamus]|uniref:Non-structural maintenance of chromosomes element 4 n=1 Tax=Acorus calamus TaxID=4465 RepID=A0AAV9E2X7_ACOCL|nr:hypothetical protein QJS10_CPA10g00091 [Acorus calamus]
MAPSRVVKREPGSTSRAAEMDRKGKAETGGGSSDKQGVTERRVIRSRYLNLKSVINDERDDIFKADTDTFKSIISEVENLHQLVQNPREQVADAEALLDIANSLVTSVKSQGNEGVSPSDFVTALLRNFGQQSEENARERMSWMDVGTAVSHILKKVPGCCTMLGPMNTEMAQRKVANPRKRTRPIQSTRPEELDEAVKEEKTDTDKNMSAMFDILRRKRIVRLECLVLNRVSFAQTVENIFALSFLIKDGRVEIKIDENGQHLVLPRNAPAANAISSGEVQYHHFVFRFDFKDWKLMKNSVGVDEELMPHRTGSTMPGSSQAAPVPEETRRTGPTTPIRKLSRNRGLVIQEQLVVEDSPENDPVLQKGLPRKSRRLRL